MPTLLLVQSRALILPATAAFSSCSVLLDVRRQKNSVFRERHSLAGLRTVSRQYSSDEETEQRERAYEAFSVLARKTRTWQRLGHLVDMAASSDSQVKTITDVGTDHGLLAMGLALSGRYEKVLGVDLSEQALRNGALSLWETVNNQWTDIDGSLIQDKIPVDFRCSNGLDAIESGEADAICIAGMGVNTMIKILSAESDSTLQLDRIECQQVLLQPTNSRPSNLIILYDHLQTSGWRLADERIEKLSSRWYVSSSFVRGVTMESKDPINLELPTSKLALLHESDPMYQTFQDYVTHHCSWIQQDAELRGTTNQAEQRWVAKFGTIMRN
jgi:tRNA A22 N-methylase